jgi:hypothetical protein
MLARRGRRPKHQDLVSIAPGEGSRCSPSTYQTNALQSHYKLICNPQ